MTAYRYHRKSTFWAWLIGLAILVVLVWGVWEIFDSDYREVDVPEGEVGWVTEPAPQELDVQPPPEEVESPEDEYGELRERNLPR